MPSTLGIAFDYKEIKSHTKQLQRLTGTDIHDSSHGVDSEYQFGNFGRLSV